MHGSFTIFNVSMWFRCDGKFGKFVVSKHTLGRLLSLWIWKPGRTDLFWLAGALSFPPLFRRQVYEHVLTSFGATRSTICPYARCLHRIPGFMQAALQHNWCCHLPTCKKPRTGSRIARHRREIRKESPYELVIIYVADRDYGPVTAVEMRVCQSAEPEGRKGVEISNVHMRGAEKTWRCIGLWNIWRGMHCKSGAKSFWPWSHVAQSCIRLRESCSWQQDLEIGKSYISYASNWSD